MSGRQCRTCARPCSRRQVSSNPASACAAAARPAAHPASSLARLPANLPRMGGSCWDVPSLPVTAEQVPSHIQWPVSPLYPSVRSSSFTKKTRSSLLAHPRPPAQAPHHLPVPAPPSPSACSPRHMPFPTMLHWCSSSRDLPLWKPLTAQFYCLSGLTSALHTSSASVVGCDTTAWQPAAGHAGTSRTDRHICVQCRETQDCARRLRRCCSRPPPLLQAEVLHERRRRIVPSAADHRASGVRASRAGVEALRRGWAGQGWCGRAWSI